MSVTQFNAADIQEMVVKAWSDVFMQELRESLLLGALVNKDYSGSLAQLGDEVTVSQINAPQGETRTVGVDADSFNPSALSATSVKVKADKRFVASYEFEDTVMLMSQLGAKDSEIRQSLVFALSQQINDYLFSLVAPSSSPDHTVTGVTDFNASQVSNVRKLAAQAKWMNNKPWYILADPSYYTDILNAQTLTSSEYGAADAPVISGQVALKRFGFNILEDNSKVTDTALAFHPDFLLWVMKQDIQFKVSDLHSNKKFGMVMSADLIGGAKLGIAGDVKHITVAN
jgi:hypothetical protein